MTQNIPSPADAAVCVVGLGCVLPGAATVDTYWDNLLGARRAIGPVPARRWNPAIHCSDDRHAPDKTYACQGGFIDDGLLRTLAADLDVDWERTPRLTVMALDACHQALAGFEPGRLAAIKVDLVLGCMAADESAHMRQFQRDCRGTLALLKARRPADWQAATAVIEDYFAQRLRAGIPEPHSVLTTSVLQALKQRFGLHGEGALIDAACASSLAAIDIAATRLRRRRCDLAISGGIEGDLDVSSFVLFSKVGALAESACYPFDARTQGLVQGEGAVLFVLQRLADALAQGRPIYGIIAGCGGASDGRSASLFSPSSAGQRLAFQRAYAQAGPKVPTYVECHGTGTPVGDTTELTTLGDYFTDTRLHIGSVKALIGHTKGAAGAAGLLKAVLALRQRVIPPSPYFSEPIKPLQNLAVNVDPLPLDPDRPPLRFGVSSFGFGNINYHLVLDEFSSAPPTLFSLTPVDSNDPAAAGRVEGSEVNNDEIVVVGCAEVSGVDTEARLADAHLNISPASLAQTDRRQLLAAIGAREALHSAAIRLDQLDRDRVCVIAAGCLFLPSAQAFNNRVLYDSLLPRLEHLSNDAVQLVRERKDRFAPVSEDTGPGILNNVIAGKVCNLFNFKGKNFNVDADFLSIPVALELAAGELRAGASLALVLCSDERLEQTDGAAELKRERFFCLLLATQTQAQQQAYPIQGILDDVRYHQAAR